LIHPLYPQIPRLIDVRIGGNQLCFGHHPPPCLACYCRIHAPCTASTQSGAEGARERGGARPHSLPHYPAWSTGHSRMAPALRLEDVGVLRARELLPLGDLHHIGVDLQPIAIGVQEVEGAAAAAPKGVPRTAPALRSMDQAPL